MMNKKLAVIVIGVSLALITCAAPKERVEVGGVAFEKLNLEEAVTKAAELNKLVLIDFFSPT